MSIQIGPIRLEDPVVLAPMSGVTDLPFRRLVKRSGAGLVVSEMIASQALIREIAQIAAHGRAPRRKNSPWQSSSPAASREVMAEAAKLNEDRGAALIDINFGCPVKKVVNGHAGSSLMRDEVHAGRILEATVKAVKLPVTLKMRTGWDDANRNAPQPGPHRRGQRHPHDHHPWPHPLPVLRRQGRLGLRAPRSRKR